MSSRIDVLAVGNAIVDIFARCDDSLLADRDIGKGMMNLVDADRSASLYADIADAREISGGSVANTAVGIVACRHSELDSAVTYGKNNRGSLSVVTGVEQPVLNTSGG